MRTQRTPTSSPEVADALMALGQLTRLTFTDVSRTLGQPVQQMQALCQLTDGSRSMSQLAHSLGLTGSSATELIDRIEARGLVQRQVDLSDRRVLRVALTTKGTLAADRAHAEVVERLAAATTRLTPKELAVLSSLISKLLSRAA